MPYDFDNSLLKYEVYFFNPNTNSHDIFVMKKEIVNDTIISEYANYEDSVLIINKVFNDGNGGTFYYYYVANMNSPSNVTLTSIIYFKEEPIIGQSTSLVYDVITNKSTGVRSEYEYDGDKVSKLKIYNIDNSGFDFDPYDPPMWVYSFSNFRALTNFSDKISAKNLLIFPNPTKGILNIQEGNYRIINLLGNTVKSGYSTGKIDLSDLNEGIYYIQVEGYNIEKFVKE